MGGVGRGSNGDADDGCYSSAGAVLTDLVELFGAPRAGPQLLPVRPQPLERGPRQHLGLFLSGECALGDELCQDRATVHGLRSRDARHREPGRRIVDIRAQNRVVARFDAGAAHRARDLVVRRIRVDGSAGECAELIGTTKPNTTSYHMPRKHRCLNSFRLQL